MKIISRLRDRRFCAFCKTQRRIYAKKHIDLTNVLLAFVFALVSTFALWTQPDPGGLGLFCLFVIGAEIFVYMRWRMAVVCGLCGFDPVLYKKSPEKAALRVTEFFREQVENPRFWLSKSPLLEVQKRIRVNQKKAVELEFNSRRSKSSELAPPKSM